MFRVLAPSLSFRTGTMLWRLLSFALLSCLLLSCGGGSGDGSAKSLPASVAVSWSPGISLLAGGLGGSGNVDGTGSAARFSLPLGVAVDSGNNLYVADANNSTIRKITPAGLVTTLAGSPGQTGSTDGNGSAALFNQPLGVAVDAFDNVYVADTYNDTIRKITQSGDVTTVAGLAGSAGTADGNVSVARFAAPAGIAVDASGTIYVTQLTNTVRKIAGGVVSTLAGQPGSDGAGYADGSGSAARFSQPFGVVLDSTGNLLVADTGNQVIRKITQAGAVSTYAGVHGSTGTTDGSVSAADPTPALFNSPIGLAIDGSDNLYVADTINHTVRKISGGVVSTFAGIAGTSGSADGSGTAASFNFPAGMVLAPSSGMLFVADMQNNTIRKINPAKDVTTFAGRAAATGTANGTGDQARMLSPEGLALDPDGNVLVADRDNSTIRRITPAGVMTTVAGVPASAGFKDGLSNIALFSAPRHVAADTAGNVYVADTANHVIRKISVGGAVSTLAGMAGASGAVDGSGTTARFSSPASLAIDAAGFLYVADTGNHAIRKVSPDGVVSTLAGTLGTSGSADGTGIAATFNFPLGLSIDLAGNLYVADSANHAVRKVTSDGVVTTLAGVAGTAGMLDATGTAAKFNAPLGIAVDADGNVYVADSGNNVIRAISPGAVVTTVAGMPGAAGVVLGNLPGGLNSPHGLVIAADGSLYASTENSVVRIALAAPVNRFGISMHVSSTTAYVGQAFSLDWLAVDAASCQASGDWSGSQPVSGSHSVTPLAPGTATYTLTCTRSGSASTATGSVTVTTLMPPPVVTLSASASHVLPGDSVTLTWSSTTADSCTSSGDWTGSRAVSGSADIVLSQGLKFFTLTCTSSGGSGSATVSVSASYPLPVVTLTASPLTIGQGQSTTLTWSSTNATACTAAGAWTGSRSVSGSLAVTPAAGNQTYTLVCTGLGGNGSQSVTVTVNPAAAAGSSGGGAGDIEMLAGLVVLGLLRRRMAAARG